MTFYNLYLLNVPILRVLAYILIIGLLMAGMLSGCASSQLDRLKNVGKAPPLQPVENPIRKPGYKPVDWPSEPKEAFRERPANSLWQSDSRTFFRDARAREVGDILTVRIRINDRAEIENTTERTRTNTETLPTPAVFGLENKLVTALPGEIGAENWLNINGNMTNTGEGTIEREELVETVIAAIVTQKLPNGNLVIQGDQEVLVNYEVRHVSVEGVVRPIDISAENEVDLAQIAMARVSYGGRGQISDVQQPRIGSQIVDILSPF